MEVCVLKVSIIDMSNDCLLSFLAKGRNYGGDKMHNNCERLYQEPVFNLSVLGYCRWFNMADSVEHNKSYFQVITHKLKHMNIIFLPCLIE